jgi:type I restriction enzyme S subunit
MSFIRLGDVASSRKGKKPKSLSSKQSATHTIPYVDIKAFEQGKVDAFTDGTDTVLCEDGDLLIVWDGSRSGLVGRAIRGAIGSTIARIDSEELISDYLYYFLQSKYHELNTRQRGTGTPHVDPRVLWDFEIFQPGLSEQEKIVAKIEELLSEVDKGMSLLKTTEKELIQYKQSLLNSLFRDKDMVRLGEMVDDVRYGTSKKCDKDASLTPVLRIPNIVNGEIDKGDLKYAEFDKKEVEKLSLKVGDLLVIRSNGSPSIVGKCAEVGINDEGFLFAGYLIRLRFNPVLQSARFYKYLLSSPKLREQIEFKAKSTSGVNNINAEELKSLLVPKLSLTEQEEIIKILDEKYSEMESLKRTIKETNSRLNNIKQSILSKAFKGELV